LLLLAIVLLAGAAFAVAAAQNASPDGTPRHAGAVLYDASGAEIGRASFVEDATGVLHVNVHAKGLTPGLHGIHLHAVGACSPGFAAAGGHHNPLARQHGLENPLGSHAGDLPNLEVNEAGVGRLTGTTDRATLSPGATSLFDADGSAVIIHAGADDQLTDPTGNSGGRVACGVIQ
jgi:Cu-Zn family superoxide dismutase